MMAGQTARARTALPALECSDGNILSLWALKKRLMRCSPSGVGGFFRAFREVTRFLRAKRALRKSIRSQKRQQLLDSLQLVEDAANRATTTGMCEYVKLLCPKTRRQRIRLRSEDGSLVTKQTECEMLAEHARGLWKSKRPQPELPPLLPIAGEIFGVEAWASAIKIISSVKAVPVFTTLGTTWKQSLYAASEQLANLSWCSLSSSRPFILKEWTSVQIAWLPKPGKSPSQPAHLRSLGLMSVDQKALLHIIKGHLKPHVLGHLHAGPQYAYRSYVSTADAILRASCHCATVRGMLETYSSDLTSKIAGSHKQDLIGGVMASIDLAKAFDTMPHSEIYISLQEAGVPESLCRLVLHLHSQTQCVILHSSKCEVVPMRRGLRQGCPIAPIIFAA